MKLLRILLAIAYARGFKDAAKVAGECCGCNIHRDDPINPYDGSTL